MQLTQVYKNKQLLKDLFAFSPFLDHKKFVNDRLTDIENNFFDSKFD